MAAAALNQKRKTRSSYAMESGKGETNKKVKKENEREREYQ